MLSPLKWTQSFIFSRFQPTLRIRQGIYSLADDDSHRIHVVNGIFISRNSPKLPLLKIFI